ncbi:MAG: DUF6430 domain-containing protein [Oscillospiraceae bacterium]|nr:DUF6430 domain-containing protein [Oscillospiraceae bacterium]
MIEFFFQRYWNNIKSFFIRAFSSIGVSWTGIEILQFFFPNQSDVLNKMFILIIIVSIFISIILSWPKRQFEYSIKNKDVKIKLVIGNLLKQKGSKIVPTNTTFDTKTDSDFISMSSVQGQVQDKFFKNNIRTLDSLIENELKLTNLVKTLDRKSSKNKQYSIGTTIEINQLGNRFYFVADSDINEKGQTVKPSYENILVTLESLWEYILENGHIETINIPLIGTGRMGIIQSREKILKQIIFSFMANNNTKKIANELVICIRPEDVQKYKIDIKEMKEYLEYMCRYYYENDSLNIIPIGTEVEEEITII